MDSIADFLTQLRNAYLAQKTELITPYSKFNHQLAKILSKHGYVGPVTTQDKVPHKKLHLDLLYQDSSPLLTHIERVSKPSVRIYTPADKIPHALSGQGLVILSTSQGLLTDIQARKKNLGGEIICKVW